MRTIKEKLGEFSVPSPAANTKNAGSELRYELDRLYRPGHRDELLPVETPPQMMDLTELTSGKWHLTRQGDIFIAEHRYLVNKSYGTASIDLLPEQFPLFKTYFDLDSPDCREKLLFFDTETTGLSGGSGTFAFLLGAGWYEKDEFVVRQYFLPELDRETAFLKTFAADLSGRSLLITFNGKSYDVPLMNNRFILNRMIPVLDQYMHLDLLQYVRLLWKYSMENCRLQTVEIDKLGVERMDDVPGELIPGYYFDYLRHHDARKISGIFKHNELDIVSMAATLIRLLNTLEQKHPEDNPQVDFAKGRFFTRQANVERSARHYRNVLQKKISPARRQKTLLELAALHKKAKQWNEAHRYWQEALVEGLPFALEPYVELAKYYEHHLKQYETASHYIEIALKQIPPRREIDLAELGKRYRRLTRKCAIAINSVKDKQT